MIKELKQGRTNRDLVFFVDQIEPHKRALRNKHPDFFARLPLFFDPEFAFREDSKALSAGMRSTSNVVSRKVSLCSISNNDMAGLEDVFLESVGRFLTVRCKSRTAVVHFISMEHFSSRFASEELRVRIKKQVR